MTSAEEQGARSAEDRLAVLINRLLGSMDAAASTGAWDRVVERWGKQGAMDLIAAVGYYTLVSFALNIDRYPVPGDETPLEG